MTDILIDAQAVGRRYVQGEVSIAAVVSATFRLQPGERVALVGPSGCGKSTLLHLMAGLDTPTSGKIEWPALGGADSLRPEKIAMVFQAPSLLEPLTVSENVAVPLLMMDSARDIDKRVADALATFGLDALAHKMPEELSGGQMQRVAMARAIAGTPRVILADEPTGQLDQSTGQALLDALFAHLGETDIALVVATHDPAVAGRMERVWRMEHGRLTETVVATRTS